MTTNSQQHVPGTSLAGPGAASEREPTGEERMLAGVAHVALFGGFFFVGPLAIYFWKRQQSRFVAFHAAQATIVTIMLFALGGLAWIVAIPLSIVVGVALHQSSELVAGIAVGAIYVAALAVSALPLVVAVVAGWRAFNGQRWSIPLVGRAAEKIVARDALAVGAGQGAAGGGHVPVAGPGQGGFHG